MPYVFRAIQNPICPHQGRPNINKRTLSRYGLGSIWECSRCKKQWIIERDENAAAVWRELTEKERYHG